MRYRQLKWLAVLLVCLVLVVPVYAQEPSPDISVNTTTECSETEFEIAVDGTTGPYQIELLFGDGESLIEEVYEALPAAFNHYYPGEGVYIWSVTVFDSAGDMYTAEGEIVLEGVDAALGSMPFPPILAWEEDGVTVEFILEGMGGTAPLTAQWDLDGDGIWDVEGVPADEPQTKVYTEPGTYQAAVRLSDVCGFVDTDSLMVVIEEDAAGEEDPSEGDSCHPMAARIADALAMLAPGLVEEEYTCEQIEAIFNGDLTGSQLGFGRMWQAYKLVSDFETLTWEQVRDWHLDETGWGLLLQLDRWSDTLTDIELGALVESIVSGEMGAKDVRQAVKTAAQYDVPYDEVMQYIDLGVGTGDLNQLLKLAEEYGLNQTDLLGYMEAGYSVSDLRQAASFAERTGMGIAEVLEQHASGISWGQMRQEARDQSDDVPDEGEDNQGNDHGQGNPPAQDDKDQRTAEQLARQYECSVEEVFALYSSECDWSCVREQLRDGALEPADENKEAPEDKDQRTAERYAGQYGVSLDSVWSLFYGECDSDWNCVRKILQDK